MSLKDFIKKLRQKPEEEKTAIIWAAVIVCMAVIFVFWAVSLSHTIKTSLNQETETSAAASQAASQFEELKNDLPTLWQSLREGFASVLNLGQQSIQYAPASQSPAAISPQKALPVE